MSPRIGDDAPDFEADTTHGPLRFLEWKGRDWAILFSHPRDFTPVCTTELGRMAALAPEFERRHTKIMALSVDALESHAAWARDIEDVTGHAPNYPMVADPDRRVARLYDMIHPNASDTMTVRSVFIIGPDDKIRLTLTYPASTGRDFGEILRALDSLQLTARHGVATPVDWRPGEQVIIVPSMSDAEARERFPGFEARKPYLRLTNQPGGLPDEAKPGVRRK